MFGTSQRRPRALRFVVAALLGLFVASSVLAEEMVVDEWLADTAKVLKKTDRALKKMAREADHENKLVELLNDVTPLRSDAQQCIDQSQAALDKATKDLETLGPPAAGEDPQVGKMRRSLTGDRKAAEKRLASCRLVLLQAESAMAEISARQQAVLAQRLLTRGPHLFDVVQANLEHPTAWWSAGKGFLSNRSGLEALRGWDWLVLGVLVALGGLGGAALARRLRSALKKKAPPADRAGAFLRAFGACAARYLPVLLPVAAVALYLTFALTREPLPFVTEAAWASGLYLLLTALVNVFLSPCPPAAPYLPWPEDLAVRLGRRLKVLLVLGLLGSLLFGTVLAAGLPDALNDLVRAVYAPFLVINLIWILWLLGGVSRVFGAYGFRALLVVSLLGAVIVEWAGFRNLSLFIVAGLVGTLVGFGLALLLAWLAQDLFDGLDEGRYPWQKRLRQRFGLKVKQPVPGMVWVRLTVTLLIWGGLALWALRVWGLSEQGITLILGYLTEGFQVGSLQVVPTRLLFAILLFALLLSIARWFRQQVAPAWLKRTALERGAREAIATMGGYVGTGIALLVGLSVAGVEFQNLAIIAGALSVGIGFGLQNIVNNFVSGLILLFERPIRTGDWIVVGDVEGYVKKISIRSTLIQTFDRADVIVPNAEFISNKVTNWMLRDPWGRATIPVGVAYGSDTELVKQTLLEVAHAHPLVMTDGARVSPPKVLFRGFGDSSLDFELRCFISVIDKRLSVISELNFAIDAAFRKEGIDIPFPQRDLHVRSMPSEGPGSGG